MILAFHALDQDTITVLNRANWHVAEDLVTEHNRFLLVDRHDDVEEVLAALARAGVDTVQLSFVVGGDEWAVTTAAVLCAALDLPGMSVDTALACRDKSVQKQAIRAAGIPCADSVPLDPVSDASPGALTPLLPGVLKPVAGASAAGTYAVRDGVELASRLDELVAAKSTAQLFESWVEGPEWHMDGVVRDGELHVAGLSRYRKNPIDVHSGVLAASITSDPGAHPRRYAAAAELTRRSLAAVGLTDGIFHLELFDTADGLVFGEVAARAGGGLIVDVMMRKFGVNIQEARARIALGLPQPTPPPPDPAAFGWTFLGLPVGVVRDVPDPEQMLAQPGVQLASVDVRPGELMPDMSVATSRRAGIALLAAESEAELERRMDHLTSWFRGGSTVV